jgi:hypothetical protein
MELKGHKDRGEQVEFWKLGWRLMNSHAYQVSAFNYVHHGWQDSMKVDMVNSVMKEVKELVENRATEIDFRRVYIPKSEGRVRPLGVPSLSWRVYLHMLNNLLVWSKAGSEGSQHAYVPQRGVHTAWAEILRNIDSSNIYEFDLKGFFDNVSLINLYNVMWQEYSIPRNISSFFLKMNRSLVKLQSIDKQSEPDRSVAFTADMRLNPNLPKSVSPPPLLYRVISNLPGATGEAEPITYEEGFKKVSGWKGKGVPQGAPTSCALSTWAISHITNSQSLETRFGIDGCRVVMYADDGIIFLDDASKLDKILSLFESSGVELNMSKSGWIKKDGKWLKPLKFLGIKFTKWGGVYADLIEASTRKGATLKFTIFDQFLAFLLESREKLFLEGSASHLNNVESYLGVSVKSWVYSELNHFLSFENKNSLLFTGRWKGYFLSSLYCDSWDQKTNPSVEFKGFGNTWVNSLWWSYAQTHRKLLNVPLLEGELNRLMRELEESLGLRSRFYDWLTPTKNMTMKELKAAVSRLAKDRQNLSRLGIGLVRASQALEFYGLSEEEQVGYSPEAVEKHTQTLANTLQINTYNASTFACDDLIRNYPLQVERKVRCNLGTRRIEMGVEGFKTNNQLSQRNRRRSEVLKE